ncbi:NUDIX domain-containing protein [Nocardioides montaniterrae]
MTGFACVILVDPQGRVLLQERDENPRIAPDKWGLCGGHLEPGESESEGAVRELAEETGVRLEPGAVEHFATFEVFHPETDSLDTLAVFAAATSLTDADIVLGEGRQIVFVEPGRARALDLSDSAALAVPAFLDSDLYRQLCA